MRADSQERQSDFWSGVRDIAPLMAGAFPFALLVGVSGSEGGFSVLETMATSVILFAGAAQLAMIELSSHHSPWIVVLVTVCVINLRFMIYSASASAYLARAGWGPRLLSAYLLTDQGYAMVMIPPRNSELIKSRLIYYLGASALLWLVWQAGTLAGAVLGGFIPANWQLDFAVPLTFLSLLVPRVGSRRDLTLCLVAGGAALVLVPVMPLKTGLVGSIVIAAMIALFFREKEQELT